MPDYLIMTYSFSITTRKGDVQYCFMLLRQQKKVKYLVIYTICHTFAIGIRTKRQGEIMDVAFLLGL